MKKKTSKAKKPKPMVVWVVVNQGGAAYATYQKRSVAVWTCEYWNRNATSSHYRVVKFVEAAK